MAKQKKRCPNCGHNYKGKRCHSPICAQLRALPTGRVRDWKIWTAVALLAGILGSAVMKQAEKDKDVKTMAIGVRIHKWGVKALEAGKRFGVPIQYAEAEDRRFDKQLHQVWPQNAPLHVFHAADTLLALVSDVKERFSGEYEAKDMSCWNWMEVALLSLQKDYDHEFMEHVDKVDQDYKAFRALFWGEKQEKAKRLKMFDVGGRFAVAAHTKSEAKEIVRLNSGLNKLKVRGLVDTAKVEFNGEMTSCGILLELFESPGLVAVMREVA